MSIKDIFPSATIEEAQLAQAIADRGHQPGMLEGLDVSEGVRVLAMAGFIKA